MPPSTPTTEPARTPDASGRSTGLLIATVFSLQFLVAFDMSLVNIALPRHPRRSRLQ